MKILKRTFICGLSALALTACSGSDTSDTVATDTEVVQDDAMISDGTQATTDKNIVALAQDNSQASTLVTAVTAAGLAETLSGSGPFTLFAPTNAAFAKLDKATFDGLLKPESKAKLAALLKYHVVAGNVKAADLAKLIADGAVGRITNRWTNYDYLEKSCRLPYKAL
jgi:uncharacterized surface protein with fasciclin (FAS1) repeats